MAKDRTMNKRNSSFELLRVIAMLMIVMFHIIYHCVNVQLTDKASIARLNNGLFNHPFFYKKLWILNTIMPFGRIANALFILISGYFMVSKKDKIQITPIASKLLFQQGFAVLLLVISSTVMYWLTNPIEGNKHYIGLQTITYFNDSTIWFTGYYFMVILAAFLFLNKFLDGLDHSKYTAFLIILFTFIQLGYARNLAKSLAQNLEIILLGIFLYSLGGYLKRYNPFEHVKSRTFLLIILFVYGLIYLSSYNSTILNIENYERKGTKDPFIQSIADYGNFGIVTMLLSISIFELFTRIYIPHSNLINFLGSATFMVFLIHDNAFFYSIWDCTDWITLLHNQPVQFITKLCLWTLLTFSIGILAYCIYLLMRKIFAYHKHFFLK